jgi:hypothetical protein
MTDKKSTDLAHDEPMMDEGHAIELNPLDAGYHFNRGVVLYRFDCKNSLL